MTDLHITPDKERAEEVTYSNVPAQTQEEQELLNIQKVDSRSGLLDLLRSKMALPLEQIKKEEIDAIKDQFYKMTRQEKKALEESGEVVPTQDALEDQLRVLMQLYKDHRLEQQKEHERQLSANLEKKLDILCQMKAIVEDTDHINKLYPKYQEFVNEFKVKIDIPANRREQIWKDFNQCNETFYDHLKINKELRDLDFKKNLEHKEALCKEAEGLVEVTDVVAASKRLQELHEDWRQTGPVAPDMREAIWVRFKNATSLINKNHQAYFDEKKQKEQDNEKAKQELCEALEAIEYVNLRQRQQWEAKTEFVLEQQAKWKKIGFASKKVNIVLFERFRKACDDFFARKSEFFKGLKNKYSDNLQQKERLCELAEQNKDRTDWKKATDFFVSIQNEWKTVGPVPHRHSDAVWERFKAACDYFFEQKVKNVSGARASEQQNMAQKNAIIESLKKLVETPKEENVTEAMNALMAEWKTVGHVPFKEKDKLYTAYQDVLDQLFARRKKFVRQQSMNNFESNLEKATNDGQVARRLAKEKDHMLRQYEILKGELKTYENNIGFLSFSSKGNKVNPLVKEIESKLEHIKEEMSAIQQKVSMINKKLK